MTVPVRRGKDCLPWHTVAGRIFEPSRQAFDSGRIALLHGPGLLMGKYLSAISPMSFAPQTKSGPLQLILPASRGSGFAVYCCAVPTLSAMAATRAPNGLGGPVAVSRAVWCSISASSSPPTRMTIVDSHSQIMKPTMAPSEPYV